MSVNMADFDRSCMIPISLLFRPIYSSGARFLKVPKISSYFALKCFMTLTDWK